MAFLTNTPGQFNHWNYTDENDYYAPFEAQGGNSKPWQERLADEKQWGDLKEKDFLKFARSEGYTGPKDRAFDFLLGKTDKTGKIDVPFGDYNSGGVMGPGINSGAMHPLLGYLKENNPALWQDFQAGKHYSPNNEHVGPMIGAGMLGVGALAAGAAGGGLVGGASGAEVAGATGGGSLAGGGAGASGGSGFVGGAAGGGVAGLSGTEVLGGVGAELASGTGIPSWLRDLTGLREILPDGNGNFLESLLRGGLGYLGADAMADALRDASDKQLALSDKWSTKYFNVGDPYRDKLRNSYKPGFDLASQPGYGDAFDRMADISTRAWSGAGNPANNPGIQGNILNDVWNQSYLPALTSYRGQLGQFGGMGLNTSGAIAGSGIDNAGRADIAAAPYSNPFLTGAGIFAGNMYGNQNPFGGGSNPYQLNIGGMPWGK